MAHDVILTETEVETLEQFETEAAERIIRKLEDIGDFPDPFLDRLKTMPGTSFASPFNPIPIGYYRGIQTIPDSALLAFFSLISTDTVIRGQELLGVTQR